MSKMSNLHAETAPERADAAENMVEYLTHVCDALVPIVLEAELGDCWCNPSGEDGYCLACRAAEIVERFGLDGRRPS